MVQLKEALYAECCAAGEKSTPHPPFEDGDFVTEYGVVLRVVKLRIYRLETEGWAPAQQEFSLWYGGEDDFVRIPPDIARRFDLDGHALLPWPDVRS